MPADDGAGVIRSLAVTADDVVAAVEARRQRGERVVLRATAPYSGRIRARLHVLAADADPPGPKPVVVDPTALLAPAAPAYPRPADTGDALRSDPDAEYTVERHHERHRQAVAEWRRRVRDHFVDEVVVETPTGERAVDVVVLG